MPQSMGSQSQTRLNNNKVVYISQLWRSGLCRKLLSHEGAEKVFWVGVLLKPAIHDYHAPGQNWIKCGFQTANILLLLAKTEKQDVTMYLPSPSYDKTQQSK